MPDAPPPTLLASSGEAQARERAQRLCGKVISKRYRIDEVLAMGGMGAVYKAEHVLMHKRIAVKILHPEIEGLPDLVKRFEREAVAGAHIVHPNVATATDFGELDDGSYFLVLEYVRGPTLYEIIKRGPLAPRRAVHIARQLAAALEACHETGIIHRDVKPRNVMVVEDQNDFTKLIDFGLARVNVERLSTLTAEDGARKSLEEGRVTGTGVIFGTIAYLAPEAALGMDAVDGRSDLYALGMIFYEMLAGKHPFDAVDPIELFKMQRTAKVPSIAAWAPAADVPPEIEAVALKLLEKDPERRYPSGTAVVEALDQALAEAGLEPLSSTRPNSLATPGELRSVRPSPVEEPSAGSSTGAVVGDPAELQRWSPPADGSSKWRGPPGPDLPAKKRSFGLFIGAAALIAGAAIGVQLMRSSGSRSTRTSAHADAVPAPAVTAAAPAVERSAPSAAPTPIEPAVVAPVASAVPVGSASPIDLDFDEAGARATLGRGAVAREWATAQNAFDALADKAPAAFKSRDVALATRDLAVGLEKEGAGEKVFDRLARGLGSTGVDILYDIVQSRGGSRAALRAAELLRETEVIKRATPELRIAFELRDAPCEKKGELLERAGKEGDVRTLNVLKTMTASCFKKTKALALAINAVTERVQKADAAEGKEPVVVHASPPKPKTPPRPKSKR